VVIQEILDMAPEGLVKVTYEYKWVLVIKKKRDNKDSEDIPSKITLKKLIVIFHDNKSKKSKMSETDLNLGT
jgi:hypothetical protein